MAKKRAKDKTLVQWLVPHLRSISRRWPQKNEALNNAKVVVDVGYYQNGNPKTKIMYKCANCGDLFDKTEVDVDHIIPVANLDGFENWDKYINAMFCPADNLQVLCKGDHIIKTNLEKQERQERKRLDRKNKKSEDLY